MTSRVSQWRTNYVHAALTHCTAVGDETTNLGGGTPDTGCGTPFRSVPTEFNHWTTH